jgi:hypothetical protein
MRYGGNVRYEGGAAVDHTNCTMVSALTQYIYRTFTNLIRPKLDPNPLSWQLVQFGTVFASGEKDSALSSKICRELFGIGGGRIVSVLSSKLEYNASFEVFDVSVSPALDNEEYPLPPGMLPDGLLLGIL